MVASSKISRINIREGIKDYHPALRRNGLSGLEIFAAEAFFFSALPMLFGKYSTKLIDYRDDNIKWWEKLFGNASLLGLPVMLGSYGLISLSRGAVGRLAYLPLAAVSLLKALFLDFPLQGIANKIRKHEHILKFCEKRLNGEILTEKEKERLFIDIRRLNLALSPAQINLIMGDNVLNEDQKKNLYQLAEILYSQKYALISKGTKYNSWIAWFGQVYNFVMGFTFFTTIHEGKDSRKLSHPDLGMVRADFKTLKEAKEGVFNDAFGGKANLYDILKFNFGQEIKSFNRAFAEVFGPIIFKVRKTFNPSYESSFLPKDYDHLSRIFRGQDPDVNEKIQDLEQSTGKKAGLIKKILIAFSNSALMTTFNLGCSLSRFLAFAFSAIGISQLGIGHTDKGSAYYTETQYVEDLKSTQSHPMASQLYDWGDNLLTVSRAFSTVGSLSQAFGTNANGYFTPMMLSSSGAYGISTVLGSGMIGGYNFPIVSQFFTALGTTFNLLAFLKIFDRKNLTGWKGLETVRA